MFFTKLTAMDIVFHGGMCNSSSELLQEVEKHFLAIQSVAFIRVDFDWQVKEYQQSTKLGFSESCHVPSLIITLEMTNPCDDWSSVVSWLKVLI
jgi:hypothetical protein